MFQCHVKHSSRLLIDRKLNERSTIASFYSIAQYIFFGRNAKPKLYNLKLRTSYFKSIRNRTHSKNL